MGGNTLRGRWAYVKEESLVELNLETAEIPPESQEIDPDGFKPGEQYIALLNESGDRLEVLPVDRETYKLLLDADKGQKRQKTFIVLSKE